MDGIFDNLKKKWYGTLNLSEKTDNLQVLLKS